MSDTPSPKAMKAAHRLFSDMGWELDNSAGDINYTAKALDAFAAQARRDALTEAAKLLDREADAYDIPRNRMAGTDVEIAVGMHVNACVRDELRYKAKAITALINAPSKERA